MIDFTKIFQLKGLKPKNKGHTNFYECCNLKKKVYLEYLVYAFQLQLNQLIKSKFDWSIVWSSLHWVPPNSNKSLIFRRFRFLYLTYKYSCQGTIFFSPKGPKAGIPSFFKERHYTTVGAKTQDCSMIEQLKGRLG